MVVDRDPESVSHRDGCAGHFDVRSARLWITARMVVGEDDSASVGTDRRAEDLRHSDARAVGGSSVDLGGAQVPPASIEHQDAEVLPAERPHLRTDEVVDVFRRPNERPVVR
ncbi:hypothetical protein L6V77_11070 [Myxococcota bacterium]|nr:hypothetical protein [Myxococcota bacterium]